MYNRLQLIFYIFSRPSHFKLKVYSPKMTNPYTHPPRSQGLPLHVRKVGSFLVLVVFVLCFFLQASDKHRSLRALTATQALEEQTAFHVPVLSTRPSPAGTHALGSTPDPTIEPTTEPTPETLEPTTSIETPEPTLQPTGVSATGDDVTLEPTASLLRQPEEVVDVLRRDELHEQSLLKAGQIRQDILGNSENITINSTMVFDLRVEEPSPHHCDQPVSEEWIPPPDASDEKIEAWVDAVTESFARIRTTDLGGDTLRSLGKEEMARLDALRDELFCGRDN